MRVEVAQLGVVDTAEGDDALGRADAHVAPAVGADQREPHAPACAAHERERLEQRRQVLARLGGSDAQQVGRLERRGARTAREHRLDRVRDHAQVAVRHVEQADGVARGGARDADHPVGVAHGARHQRAPVVAAPGREPGGLAQHCEIVHRDDGGHAGLAQRPAERRAVQHLRVDRARLPGEAEAVPGEILLQRVALLPQRPALLKLAIAELDQLDVVSRLQRVAQADRQTRRAGARLRETGDVEGDGQRGHGPRPMRRADQSCTPASLARETARRAGCTARMRARMRVLAASRPATRAPRSISSSQRRLRVE